MGLDRAALHISDEPRRPGETISPALRGSLRSHLREQWAQPHRRDVVQPVEINAGTWYLRALRADERITDVPALSHLEVDDPAAYVAAAQRDWESETRFVWAICIPTTGELIALIGVTPNGSSGRLWGEARDGYDEALDTAVGPVSRFAEGALGLVVGQMLSRGIG
ncbi:hypothetical protein GA0061091_1042 [Gordonia sp. v-85]|nr:hypothetical protein GA0061091_1042 [Gordonia sp. v-85]